MTQHDHKSLCGDCNSYSFGVHELSCVRLAKNSTERNIRETEAVSARLVTAARIASELLQAWSTRHTEDLHAVQFALFGALAWGFDPNNVSREQCLRAIEELAVRGKAYA